MDIRKIKKLIELVEESGIAELEISEGEESVRISRSPANMGYPVMQQAYAALLHLLRSLPHLLRPLNLQPLPAQK